MKILNAKVMVVDDNDLFRESLAHNLAEAGFDVCDLSGGAAALEHLAAAGSPDLAIFDWCMPGMTGIELLKRVRQGGHALPVIFLTSLTEQIYEEAALTTGAVDFVEKTRSFAIVLKRIKLILEGAKTRVTAPVIDSPGEEIAAGPLTLRPKTGRALWKGQAVELTLTEFHMVAHLAGHAGDEVTYRALYDVVHGSGFMAGIGDDGYRANVRTFIKRIRRKFCEIDAGFDAIENYAGFGYRWKKLA